MPRLFIWFIVSFSHCYYISFERLQNSYKYFGDVAASHVGLTDVDGVAAKMSKNDEKPNRFRGMYEYFCSTLVFCRLCSRNDLK